MLASDWRARFLVTRRAERAKDRDLESIHRDGEPKAWGSGHANIFPHKTMN